MTSSLKKITLLLLLTPLLTGCFGKKAQEPEMSFDELMRNAKQNTMEAEFASMQFDVSIQGQDSSEKVEGEAEIDFLFDRSGDTHERQIHFVGQGGRDKGEGLAEASVDVTALGVKGVVRDDVYLRLNALELSGNPDFEEILPLLQGYLGHWLNLPPKKLPETLQQFQVQQDSLQQERELSQQIFVSTKLFNLQKYYGVEKAGPHSRDAYHYSVTLDPMGLENYNQQLVVILNDQPLTQEELQKKTAGFKYVQGLELWIDVETFRIVQAKLLLSGEDLFQDLQGNPLNLEVEVMMMADFSTPVSLEAPVSFVVLDALQLFTQAAQLLVVQEVEVENDGG